MATRHASAKWEGSLKEGKGVMSTGSGAFNNLAYSFGTRFEATPGTNPEELIAAAQSGCFSMAFSANLGNQGITPTAIETQAVLTFDKQDAGWTITGISLNCTVKAPGADKTKIEAAAKGAKEGCPISRLLKTNITLNLKIEN